MLKQKLPSEEEMQEYIGKVKNIKELYDSSAGGFTDEQQEFIAGLSKRRHYC